MWLIQRCAEGARSFKTTGEKVASLWSPIDSLKKVGVRAT